MSDESEGWDEEITALLSGRGSRATEPTAVWLAAASRPSPPPDLLERVDRRIAGARRAADRPGRWLTGVAAALAAMFVLQGTGNLVFGDWIARNLGEDYAPHVSFEGGLALIALGVCAAAGGVSRSWSAVSVLACAPLAIGFGVSGVGEIDRFAAGAALHLIEGVLGLSLIAAWWWDRRDARAARREDGT